mmetsp:Transcript_613/g.1110  ORF Transcript_613/g.1110 Transcript_613/m.1110 type:complete len:270 (+) Transcript_613:767-1576(+)
MRLKSFLITSPPPLGKFPAALTVSPPAPARSTEAELPTGISKAVIASVATRSDSMAVVFTSNPWADKHAFMRALCSSSASGIPPKVPSPSVAMREGASVSSSSATGASSSSTGSFRRGSCDVCFPCASKSLTRLSTTVLKLAMSCSFVMGVFSFLRAEPRSFVSREEWCFLSCRSLLLRRDSFLWRSLSSFSNASSSLASWSPFACSASAVRGSEGVLSTLARAEKCSRTAAFSRTLTLSEMPYFSQCFRYLTRLPPGSTSNRNKDPSE